MKSGLDEGRAGWASRTSSSMLLCVCAEPPPLRSDIAATLLGLAASEMMLVVLDEVVAFVDEVDVEVLLDVILLEELEELCVVEDLLAWA